VRQLLRPHNGEEEASPARALAAAGGCMF